jgi:hypothetical protein
MVVFMIMASQFKSLRLPFVMLFTIPVSLVGIVLALLAAGQGFSITALMGVLMVIGIAVSNGILLVDDANRRFIREGVDKVEAVIAVALRADRDDELRDRDRLGSYRDGAGTRIRGQSATRAVRRWRPDVFDDPVTLPRTGHVPILRKARRSRR